MKIVIADDEPLARALLRTLLNEVPGTAIMAEVEDGPSAIEAVRTHRPDIVFLDIDMPGQNGIHAGLEIARHGTELIFVTAHEDHAVDAFDMGAVDYLLKPVRRLRLAKAMERARRRFDARSAHTHGAPDAPAPSPATPDAFWVPVRHGTVRVAFCDIVRIEAAGDLVYLHTSQRTYMYRTTMGELEGALQDSGLTRVHRSAFVRIDRVIETRRRGKVTELVLDDGARVPVGPSFRAVTLAQLRDGIGVAEVSAG
jgi:two-component system LytT family response regulator